MPKRASPATPRGGRGGGVKLALKKRGAAAETQAQAQAQRPKQTPKQAQESTPRHHQTHHPVYKQMVTEAISSGETNIHGQTHRLADTQTHAGRDTHADTRT